ncbi:hypothetical protein ANN_01153 [Periplaneta americana]|uniref:DUF4817 domain-containing protein n=1 Tax=Periplaneta americana TaxID=6978 RepID=A0ABQ8TW55_PERAM|nr:hypothetical protein ANN_01153 [Periplaneta americana]
MERWTGEQRGYSLKAYYLHNESLVQTRRAFRLHFNIPRNQRVTSGKAIRTWHSCTIRTLILTTDAEASEKLLRRCTFPGGQLVEFLCVVSRRGDDTIRNMLLDLNDSCEQYRMKINANKTKIMVVGKNEEGLVWRELEYHFAVDVRLDIRGFHIKIQILDKILYDFNKSDIPRKLRQLVLSPFLKIGLQHKQDAMARNMVHEQLTLSPYALRQNSVLFVNVKVHYIVSHSSDESHRSEKDYLCCNCYVTALTTSYRTHRLSANPSTFFG